MKMKRLPKIGDQARIPDGFVPDLRTQTGRVVEIVAGACGPLVAVQVPDSPHPRTVDVPWRRVRPA